MKHLHTIGFVICTAFLISCASTYQPIQPNLIDYGSPQEKEGVEFSYRANVLQLSGNKKYVKKETRGDISLIAVKIKNNTNEDVVFNEDMILSSGNQTFEILTPGQITSVIKQSSGLYLFYLLLTPMKLYIQTDEEINEYPIGYGIGPGLALGNMAVAAGANSDFSDELIEYNLQYRTVKSGETVYGLVGIRNFNHGMLSIEIVD